MSVTKNSSGMDPVSHSNMIRERTSRGRTKDIDDSQVAVVVSSIFVTSRDVSVFHSHRKGGYGTQSYWLRLVTEETTKLE